MKKNWKKILVALAFVLCMVAPSVIYANAEDTTEETTTPSDGDVVTVDGAKFVYYADVQAERTSKDATKTNKDGSTTKYYSAPTYQSGYIFAGWYTDNSGTVDAENPLTETELTDTSIAVAWAKFVPSSILSVKAQVMGGINYASESTSIRFVTSVDTLNYRKVGFDFVVFDESNTKYGRETNTVYEALYAVGSDGKVLNYTPDYVFNTMSEYFMAYTFNGLKNKDFGHGIKATPYWITLDGTYVEGTASAKTVNQAYTGAITSMTMTAVTSGSGVAHPSTSDWNTTPIISITKTVHSQGGCTYGDYYYQAVINRYPGRSGTIGNYTYDETKNEVLIQRYKKNTSGQWTLDAQSASPMALYHANDITYNENLTYTGQTTSGLLVVSHNAGNTKLISFVDPSSLSLVQPSNVKHANGNALALAVSGTSYITISKDIYSIDYNAFTDRYVVGLTGGQTYCILDADFNVVSSIYNQTQHKTTEYTHQGVVADDSFVYFVLYYYPDDGVTPEHDGHLITVYDWNGNAINTIEIPTTSIAASIEPENIGIYNNEIYVSCANGSYTSIYKVTEVEYSKDYAAFIDNTEGDDEYYFTLESAVMNAEEGDTIVLLKDVTITSPMPVLVNDITITNQADTAININRGSAYTGTMFDNEATGFSIKKNSTGSLNFAGNDIKASSMIINEENASMSLEEITLSKAQTNGVGVVANKGTLNVTSCKFANNTASGAGAIRSDGGTVNITGCEFDTNTASSGNGGAISGTADFTIVNSTFTGNQAYLNGGAIHNGGSAVAVIQGCTFNTNTANGKGNDKQGGGAIFSEGTLTIENYVEGETSTPCTFDGNKGAYDGGAIRFASSKTLTINNAEFKNNTAGADGGAVHSNTGTLKINSANFTSNSADRGGALYAEDNNIKTTITGGTYTGNTASTAGGAFNQGTGTATISGVTMQNNSVGESYDKGGGGAITIGGGTQLTLTNSTVNGNTSTYAGEDADKVASDIGFRNNSATGQPRLILTDSKFDGIVSWADKGTSKNYGLVQFETEYTGNGITFCKLSTFEDGQNLAEFEGEWTDEAKLATVDKVTVSHCEGQYLYDVVEETGAYGELNIAEATLTTSEVTTSYKYISGAVVAAVAGNENTVTVQRDAEVKSTVEVDDTITLTNAEGKEINIYRGTTDNMFNVTGDMTITGSITIDGRTKVNATKETPDTTGTSTSKTMILLDAGKLTLSGTTLQYANGSSSGGAVYVQNGGNMTASGTTFANNRAQNGAGIFVAKPSASTIEIKDESVFEGNVATTSGGGAIYSNKDAEVEAYLYLTNTTFKENSSKSQDGAVQVGGSAMTFIVDSCDFIGNYSAGDGGAVGVTSSTLKAEFKGTGKFEGNYVTGSGKAGGAINTNTSAISITGYTFDSNYAPSGGAINIKANAAPDKSDVNITDCTFTNNKAKTTNGGAIYNLGRVLNISGGSFTGNIAAKDGGAICSNPGKLSVSNANFNENVAARAGAIYKDSTGTITIAGGEFKSNIATEGAGAINVGTGTGHTIAGVTMQENAVNPSYTVEGITLANAKKRFGGGAILIGGAAQISLTNVNINGNSAAYVDTDTENLVSSDITFRDNSASGTALLILEDSSFDGVVSWRPKETSTNLYFGKIRFDAYYDGEGITVCKADYLTDEPIAGFGDTLTDEQIIKSVAKLEVRSDYVSTTEYETGKYCVANRTLTYEEQVEDEEGNITTETTEVSGGMILGTEAIIAKEDVPTTYYGSLYDAVTAAESGDTVTVVKADITVDKTISVDKEVTVTNKDGVEPTITRGSELTAAMFAITADGNLDVDGEIVLDGAEVEASASLITNAGTLTLGTDTVVQNGVTVTTSNAGGALYNTGTAYIYGDFKNNQRTGQSGGAIKNMSGTLYIEGSTFENNIVHPYVSGETTTNYDGGAISTSGGTCEIKNSTFQYNKASKNGGAIHSNSTCATTIYGCTFTENIASYNNSNASGGGAIIVENTARITSYTTEDGKVIPTTFTGNQADSQGGAIRFNANSASKVLTIEDAVFSGNKVVNTSSGYGGAIYNNGAAIINMSGASFTKNSARLGGALYIVNASTVVTATDCVFGYIDINNTEDDTTDDVNYGNYATDNGGAIYLENGTLKLNSTSESYSDSKVEGNYVTGTNKTGGAIYAKAGTLYVGYDADDTTKEQGYAFNKNHSTNQGGACWISSSTTAYINASEFTGNYNTNASGGAIYSNSKSLTVKDTTFTGNTATSTGGAIIVTSSATMNAINCAFYDNTAKSATEGGAVSISGTSTAHFTVANNGKGVFDGNKAPNATRGGGAIYSNSSTITIDGYEFKDNSAPKGKGGAIYIYTSGKSLTVTNSTFTNNTIADSVKQDIAVDAGTFITDMTAGTDFINGGTIAPTAYTGDEE